MPVSSVKELITAPPTDDQPTFTHHNWTITLIPDWRGAFIVRVSPPGSRLTFAAGTAHSAGEGEMTGRASIDHRRRENRSHLALGTMCGGAV